MLRMYNGLTFASRLTTPVNPTVDRLLVEFDRLFAAGYGHR
jgi:hypothetical protein